MNTGCVGISTTLDSNTASLDEPYLQRIGNIMATEAVSSPFLASLNHLSDLLDYKVERPFEIWLDKIPEGLEQTNVKFELQHNIPITDARSIGLDQFDIELHGFEFLKQKFPTQCVISGSDSANASDEQRAAILEYVNIMSDFLCETYGGVKAVCYDWRVRSQSIICAVFLSSILIPPRYDALEIVQSTRSHRYIHFPMKPMLGRLP